MEKYINQYKMIVIVNKGRNIIRLLLTLFKKKELRFFFRMILSEALTLAVDTIQSTANALVGVVGLCPKKNHCRMEAEINDRLNLHYSKAMVDTKTRYWVSNQLKVDDDYQYDLKHWGRFDEDLKKAGGALLFEKDPIKSSLVANPTEKKKYFVSTRRIPSFHNFHQAIDCYLNNGTANTRTEHIENIVIDYACRLCFDKSLDETSRLTPKELLVSFLFNLTQKHNAEPELRDEYDAMLTFFFRVINSYEDGFRDLSDPEHFYSKDISNYHMVMLVKFLNFFQQTPEERTYDVTTVNFFICFAFAPIVACLYKTGIVCYARTSSDHAFHLCTSYESQVPDAILNSYCYLVLDKYGALNNMIWFCESPPLKISVFDLEDDKIEKEEKKEDYYRKEACTEDLTAILTCESETDGKLHRKQKHKIDYERYFLECIVCKDKPNDFFNDRHKSYLESRYEKYGNVQLLKRCYETHNRLTGIRLGNVMLSCSSNRMILNDHDIYKSEIYNDMLDQTGVNLKIFDITSLFESEEYSRGFSSSTGRPPDSKTPPKNITILTHDRDSTHRCVIEAQFLIDAALTTDDKDPLGWASVSGDNTENLVEPADFRIVDLIFGELQACRASIYAITLDDDIKPPVKTSFMFSPLMRSFTNIGEPHISACCSVFYVEDISSEDYPKCVYHETFQSTSLLSSAFYKEELVNITDELKGSFALSSKIVQKRKKNRKMQQRRMPESKLYFTWCLSEIYNIKEEEETQNVGTGSLTKMQVAMCTKNLL
jgi:hypothetical protein